MIGRRFRKRRQDWLAKRYANCDSVLDIGGLSGYWSETDWKPSRLLLLNLNSFQIRAPGAWHIQANALAIPLRDQCFDLAMSNSVIEHVPDQAKFASEMMRVGRRIYCQTPSKWCPIEPHYLGLFVHWLPEGWFTHVVHRYLTLHGLVTKPEAATTDQLKREIHLLTKKDLQRLFPGCSVKTERVLGFPKSYIVCR